MRRLAWLLVLAGCGTLPEPYPEPTPEDLAPEVRAEDLTPADVGFRENAERSLELSEEALTALAAHDIQMAKNITSRMLWLSRYNVTRLQEPGVKGEPALLSDRIAALYEVVAALTEFGSLDEMIVAVETQYAALETWAAGQENSDEWKAAIAAAKIHFAAVVLRTKALFAEGTTADADDTAVVLEMLELHRAVLLVVEAAK